MTPASTSSSGDAVRDEFERYFAEKLWALIPVLYRTEDAETSESPGVLRALVDVIAEQAAALRRSQDRLWDDQFIELCEDWVIPYLGDLVGTRMVSALNTRGRRADVAKTIYYRRRAGTVALLEELIGDITGWDGTVVEMFRRLARTRHGLDPAPGGLAGRLSGTLPGGWADLRRPRAAKLAGSAWDEYHHTPDVRRFAGGVHGRHGIFRVAFHLFRTEAYAVSGVMPHDVGDGRSFTFDPSGRSVPLFTPRARADSWSDWTPPREWDLPAPIPCRLLAEVAFAVSERLVRSLEADGLGAAAAASLRRLLDERFTSERRFRETLAAMPGGSELVDPAVYDDLRAFALVDDCGRSVLLDRALAVTINGDAVEALDVVATDLSAWTTGASAGVAIDAELGRLRFLDGPPDAPPLVHYHYGAFAEIGAGTYDRREGLAVDYLSVPTDERHLEFTELANTGAAQIEDSATYSPIADKLRVLDITVQAANGERPYLLMRTNWVLNAGDHHNAQATLNGLWLGSDGDAVTLRARRRRGGQLHVGDYERVTIRSCTLDPGDIGDPATLSPPIPAVPLVIDCRVELLEIDRSIVGPIRTTARGFIEQLVITDSIVQSLDPAIPAIALTDGEVKLERVTVLGGLDVHRLHASEALITGRADVTDTQQGCFRFSAAPAGSRVPAPYESVEITDVAALFVTERFGQPGYAVLSDAAPAAVHRGAENGSEIGAHSAVLAPIKLDSLRAKVEEYMPFGLIPLFIHES